MLNSSDSNSIIKSLWIGSRLSAVEQLCVNSFLKNGHEFHLYTYDDVADLPDGIVIKDANSIIPAQRIFKDSLDTYASFADWFRYKLLHDLGGWWVDMDVVCLKHFDFPDEFCFATERLQDVDKIIVNNAVIKSDVRADFLKEILFHIDTVLNSEDSAVTWGEFGPLALDKVLSSYDCGEYIQTPECFCPLNWYEIDNIVRVDRDLDLQDSYALHLWNRMWCVQELDKDFDYAKESIFELLKYKYKKPVQPGFYSS